METVKRSVIDATGSRGREKRNKQGTDDCQSSGNTLYESLTIHTCHYTLAQTRRAYDTRSKPERAVWTLDDYDVSMWAHPW